MRKHNRHKPPAGWISAAEIACFAYCPESWRLQYGLGIEPANQDSRTAGNRHHARKSAAERVAGALIFLGRILAIIALLALLLRLVMFR